MTVEELTDFVGGLNDASVEVTGEGSAISFRPFELRTDGDNHLIEMFGSLVWQSEGDEWDPEETSLAEHLMERIATHLDSVSKLTPKALQKGLDNTVR